MKKNLLALIVSIAALVALSFVFVDNVCAAKPTPCTFMSDGLTITCDNIGTKYCGMFSSGSQLIVCHGEKDIEGELPKP